MCRNVSLRERYLAMMNPETCPHRNVDHRGSNKYVRNTFCKGCNTYIDAIDRDIDTQLEQLREQFGKSSIHDK